MKYGFTYFPTPDSARPDRVAVEAERLGFEAMFVPEHSHMPVDTPWPFGPEVPMMYKSILDPFVSLGAAAAVTEKIKLGTAIALITQRDPFNCAKEIATLDQLSNGRVILGIGAGWNEPEMENHGTDPKTRFRLMRERVEAMKQLWTQDEAEYHGRHVDFAPTWQFPKPVQKPHPPILVGGAGENVIKRVVAYGDGWLPALTVQFDESFRGRMTPVSELPQIVEEMRSLSKAAGRETPKITAGAGVLEVYSISELEDLEVNRINLGLASVPEPEAFAQLEKMAKTITA